MHSFNFRFIANAITTAFFVRNSRSYTTYSFSQEIARETGAKRAFQRFEQCLGFFTTFMKPAFGALNAINFYDQSIQKSAAELVKLAVADAIAEISKNEKIGNETRDIIINKLKSAHMWVMFPDDILNVTKIDGLYSEIDFAKPESYFELTIEVQIHNWKLQMRSKDDWITTLHTIISEGKPFYFPYENVLSEYKYYFG